MVCAILPRAAAVGSGRGEGSDRVREGIGQAARRLGAVAFVLLAACGGGGSGIAGHTAHDLATVADSPVRAAQRSEAGMFAADYLRSKHFRSLVVEVAHPQGRPPSPLVLDLLRERLAERCDKPDGVTITIGAEIPWSEFGASQESSGLGEIEDRYRTEYSDSTSSTAAMFLLFALGHGAPSDDGGLVLGTAYRGSSAAVFVEDATSHGSLYVNDDELVGCVAVHEAGHLLGLVNRGVPMVVDHEDSDHPGHEIDPTGNLFWYLSVPVGLSFGDPEFAAFSAASIADIRAFGGK